MSTQCTVRSISGFKKPAPIAGCRTLAPIACFRVNPAPSASARVRGGSPVARRRFH